MHEFADFQCPISKRVEATVIEIEKRFPGEIRLVWHNLPLAIHPRARAAANALLEIQARKGDTAFWKAHDLVFGQPNNLSDEALMDLGEKMGVKRSDLLAALQEAAHDIAIHEDEDLAKRVGILGTPAFVINGYLIAGAQPFSVFRRAIKQARIDARQGVIPKPTALVNPRRAP